jgi:pimeloyl-ACP methyl ester carboxylesterase
MPVNIFQHRQVTVNGTSIHLAETGDQEKPVILFLHGFPQNWMAFRNVMILLKDGYHLMAIDLPGIGLSQAIDGSDKKTIAAFIGDLVNVLDVDKIILAGHDVGGMITYATIKYFPSRIAAAIIMDTVLPGIEPWEEVKRNPYIWHFALFAIPTLPETLAIGRQNSLFDYFYDTLSYNKLAINEAARKEYVRAYEAVQSLSAAFGWYRGFPKDEEDNAGDTPIDLPLLYIRGEKESGDMQDYAKGLKKSRRKRPYHQLTLWSFFPG